jgi:hypothetical protein
MEEGDNGRKEDEMEEDTKKREKRKRDLRN